MSSGDIQGRSEVERRRRYFDQLEKQCAGQEGVHMRSLEALIKKCLDNDPKQRHTTLDLLSALKEMVIIITIIIM